MNNVPVQKVRNIAVVGHAACGKTSMVEVLLHAAGMTTRIGTIEARNTVSDASPEEQERQMSIRTANLFLKYDNHNVFVADTPGYIDFFGEVVAALSVCDAAIVVVDAVNGVDVGTQKAWAILKERGIPRMLVVNKLDKESADFGQAVEGIVNSFGKECVPLLVPVGSEADLSGVVPLLPNEPGGADAAQFSAFRTKLVEAVAESDEGLLEKYFSEQALSTDELTGALHKAVARGIVFPIVPCSATKQIGTEQVLKAITGILPSPVDRGAIALAVGGDLKPDPALPAAAHVFKTVTDPFVGQITYFRVYQGTMSSGTDILNITRNHKERFGDLLIIQGRETIKVDKAVPGEIVAAAKLKTTRVNDALGAAKVEFKPIVFPKPVMTVAVVSANQGDEEKLSEGLHRIRDEDATFIVERHHETHELLVSGMGDVHIDMALKRLKEKFKVEVVTSTPKVAYHETVRGTADVRYRHKKQSGGSGQFAEVAIRLKPNERDKGYVFDDQIVGGVISNSYIPSVDKGVRARMQEGVIAGCPVVDVIVELYDGKEHPVDSKDIAFQTAGRMAFSEAIEKAKPILLEPIMNVEVQCPKQFMGDITGILNGKRGRITGMDVVGDFQIIKAEVPHGEMFKFCGELRSITGGRGSYCMEFAHYAEVPSNIGQAVVEAHKKSRKQPEE